MTRFEEQVEAKTVCSLYGDTVLGQGTVFP